MFGQQRQQGQPDCIQGIVNWWTNVPFGLKTIIAISVGIYLMDLMLKDMIAGLLLNQPILVVEKYQIWRIFLTEFVHSKNTYILVQILNLAFSLLSIYFTALTLERLLGSAVFLIDLLTKSLMTQIIVIIFSTLISFAIPSVMAYPSFGLWNLVLVYISINAFSNPDTSTQFLCFPVTIKNKYYPFAILVFINIMQPSVASFAAVFLGYIEYRYFNGLLYRPSQQFINKLENSFLLSSFKSRPDYVAYNTQISGPSFTQPVNNPQASQTQQPAQEFRQWGGRGIQIGSTVGSAPSPPSMVLQELQQQAQAQPYQQITEEEESKETEAASKQTNDKKKKNYDHLGEELA